MVELGARAQQIRLFKYPGLRKSSRDGAVFRGIEL